MIEVIKRFFNFCKKEDKKKFYISIGLAVFDAIFNMLKIISIYLLLDTAFNKVVTVETSLMLFGIMLLSVLGSTLVKNKTTILQTEAGYHTCACKRMDIAEHLRYVPMGYFNDNSLGQIVSVTTNTMQNLENIATRAILIISSSLLETLIVTIMILVFDWRVGLTLVGGLILHALLSKILMKKSLEVSKEKTKADETLVDEIVDYVEGIQEVKNYKLTLNKSKKLKQANINNSKANIKMEKKLVPFLAIFTLIIKIVGVLMTLASVAFYIEGSLTIVECIVMIIASFVVYASLEQASGFMALLRSINICVDKAEKIMETEQMQLDGIKEDPTTFDIKANNISFAYNNKKIIDDISFEIPEKTTTAIVGPSGSGKTTIVNLISRFWDVDSGSITLAGKNIKDYSYDTLMKNFSFVFQRVYLFKDTIANNIRFGEPEASMERVIEAAKKAHCHEFIESLPNGYDTVIGEDGVNLSGGERQRISIARAIMKDSPIIILDEATANIDPENESLLMNAIEELTKEKTVIMIAHRLKTIENADQIFVVNEGKIVDSGTHNELINKEGIYKNFINDREQAVSWKI